MHHFVCLYLRRFGRVFVVLFLHLCVRWMHPRSLVDLHNGRGVVCCIARRVIRWSVGRSVGWWLCVWGHSVSHGVYPLWAARLSARAVYAELGGG